MSSGNRLIKIGTIGKTHGLKGGLSLNLENHHDMNLSEGDILYLMGTNREEHKEVKIKEISYGNKVICFFSEITNPEDAKKLTNMSISRKREDFPEIEEDEVYITDLIGLEVMNQDQQKLGKVSSITSNGVQDILVIKSDTEEILIPFIEQFIININLDDKKIIVDSFEVIS